MGEALETYFGSKKFKKIPPKIDDMRKEFRDIKQNVETEYQKGTISSQERAIELKERWKVIRKDYEAEKKKSIKFRNNDDDR